MQVFSTPGLSRPQRSLSYNDLKRKRLQRSASHKKMPPTHQQSSATRGRNLSEQKTVPKPSPLEHKQTPNEGRTLAGTEQRSQKRFISLRESMTERARYEKESLGQQPWSNLEESINTKQLIKNILNKNKSQRRLMRVNEIRDKLKVEKQKSRSHQKSRIARQVISPYKERPVEIEKRDRPLREDHKKSASITVKVQVNQNTVKEAKMNTKNVSNLQKYLQQLTTCPQQLKGKLWQEQLLQKQNDMSLSNALPLGDVSQIKRSQQYERFSASDQFLIDKTHLEGSFLRLLDDSRQLRGRGAGRQVRRRGEMDRLRRIFPSGFFAS